MVGRSTLVALALCVSAVSRGTTPDAPAALDLSGLPQRAGWVLWATVPVVALLDVAPLALGPQQPYTLRGDEGVLTTRGPGPYLIHMCAAGEAPPGAGWQVYLPGVGDGDL